MALDFQVTIDAQRPYDLAGWWAATLGWEVEGSDERFIRKMIAAGYATEAETMTRNGALVRPDGEDAAALVARLTSRGATVRHEGQQGRHRWVTLADPEGNEFCVG